MKSFVLSLAFILLIVCKLSFAGVSSFQSGTISLKPRGKCPADSKQVDPLIVPSEGLPFCTMYHDKSCCSEEDTLKIQESVNSLMKKECSNCYEMVAEWKCAECHPHASRFYKGSEDCPTCTSLRLCKDYCYAIYEKCKDIPFGVGGNWRNAFYINSAGKTKEEFCIDSIRFNQL